MAVFVREYSHTRTKISLKNTRSTIMVCIDPPRITALTLPARWYTLPWPRATDMDQVADSGGVQGVHTPALLFRCPV